MLLVLSLDSTLSEEPLKGDEKDETEDEAEPSDSGEARSCLSLSSGL